MSAFIGVLPYWSQVLGWTLLNSVWQALAVTALLLLALRLIPATASRARYVLACVAMMLVIALSTATFIYLMHQDAAPPAPGFSHLQALPAEDVPVPAGDFSLKAWASQAAGAIGRNMPLILWCWAAGALFFSLRMMSGWWYITRLRSGAVLCEDAWSAKLRALAAGLGIAAPVSLAESIRIQVPVVIGFFKPVVLVPAGMLSGMSPEQIETIFLHELAHIRRHDYLVNFIQSVVESVFFFNPFVWIISSVIRREREYCCDDAVMKFRGDSLAYARALTRLEEVRLSRTMFAPALAENRNLLLNRIRRIMEKSAKNYSEKDRLIPAVLLVVGLICASWVTMRVDGTARYQQNKEAGAAETAADTVDRKKVKSARYSKQVITTYDENGEPHEEVIENFEGDEELKPMMQHPGFELSPPLHPLPPDFPDAPDFSFPPLPGFDELPGLPRVFGFGFDSIPPGGGKDWHDFRSEFETRFREQFGDFYESHQQDLQEMMKELEEQFGDRFEEREWLKLDEDWGPDMEKLQRQMESLSLENLRDLELQTRKLEETMREWNEHHRENFEELQRGMAEHQKEFFESGRKAEKNMEAFKRELSEQLIKDGYLEEGGEVKSINWDSDGEIEINGKKIRDADRDKYTKIYVRYFRPGGKFMYVE